ncbi:MAG: nucleotide exchange factor GrpE [Armatimonadetes bacterium]|nr:nucleotide exchange factor GrpE [Armatimonadota bacterium]MDE2205658.1 nucleotide exchange factor GrpE [Armatimonadota bacterium]
MRRNIPGDDGEPLKRPSEVGSADDIAPLADPADADPPGPSETAAAVAQLQVELAAAQAAAESAKSDLLYERASFQNFRRRKEEEAREQARFGGREVVALLLPVLDNFERALAAAEQSANFDALVTGVRATMKLLTGVLEKSGVTPIEAVGMPFDTALHEAVGQTHRPDLPVNTVAEEVQRGYRMHDQVLRHALVKVSER